MSSHMKYPTAPPEETADVTLLLFPVGSAPAERTSVIVFKYECKCRDVFMCCVWEEHVSL